MCVLICPDTVLFTYICTFILQCSYFNIIYELIENYLACIADRSISINSYQARYCTDYADLFSIISYSNFNSSTRFILQYIFEASGHTIWHERNRRHHWELPKPPANKIKILNRLIRNRLSSLKQQGITKFENVLRLWLDTKTWSKIA